MTYRFQRYLTGQSSTADFKAPTIFCGGSIQLVIQVTWGALAGTTGTWAVEGAATADSFAPIGGPNSVSDWMDLGVTSGIYGVWPSVTPAVAGKAAVVITNVLPWMRLSFDLTAGAGNAGAFNAWYYLR
jgi:hypothetical protein